MTKTLDRMREFGSVHPPELVEGGKTRCYEQDGYSYDAQGNIIEECFDEKAAQRYEREKAREQARLIAQAAYEATMEEQGFTADGSLLVERPVLASGKDTMTARDAASVSTDGRVGAPPRTVERIDLVRWARGEQPEASTVFFRIRQQFKEQLGESLPVNATKADALRILEERGMLAGA